MATQEMGLNEHLDSEGIRAIETDLAELIVQLGEDKPSHILVPAIHKNRDQIREIFSRKMPGLTRELTDEPQHISPRQEFSSGRELIETVKARREQAQAFRAIADEIDGLAATRDSNGEPLFASGNARVIRFDSDVSFAAVPSAADVFVMGGKDQTRRRSLRVFNPVETLHVSYLIRCDLI